MKKIVIPVVALSMALSLGACGDDNDDAPQYREICVTSTGLVADPQSCEGDYDHSAFLMYYMLYSLTVPLIGHPVSGGTYVKPASGVVFKYDSKTGKYGTGTKTKTGVKVPSGNSTKRKGY